MSRREMDLRGAAMWKYELRDQKGQYRRAVAFDLALWGPGVFGCRSIGDVAAKTGVSERTLRYLRDELQGSYGIFMPVADAPASSVAADFTDESALECGLEGE
jgi:hypothetical protein